MTDPLLPLIVAAVNLAGLLIVLLAAWFLPNMSRPSIFFGVTVDPDLRKTPLAIACIRRFRWRLLLHTLLAMLIGAGLTVLLWAGLDMPLVGIVWGSLAATLWQVLGLLLAYVSARRKVLPHAVHPTSVREASLQPRGLAAGGKALFVVMTLVPLLLILACGLYLHMRWDDIPPRFPSHWGLDGRPNGWTNKSILGVYGLFLLALAIDMLFVVIAAITTRARRVHASGPAAAREIRFQRNSQAIVLLLGCCVVAFVAAVATCLPLRASSNSPWGVVLWIVGGSLLVDIAAMIALLRMGQGGSRLPAEPAEPSGPEVVGDRTDDRYWKWGVFYSNPNDPALWVEKRFGIGWTMNMARPGARAILITILVMSLLPAVALPLVLRYAQRHATSAQRQPSGFQSDPDLIGTWKSVDYIPRIEDFNPKVRQCRVDLYLKQLIIQPDGTIEDTAFTWTKGLIHAPDDGNHPAHYQIRRIDGQTYLFFEWISGDVTLRGRKPQYYVLRKESS